MLKRILSFIGWSIASLCFVMALFGLSQPSRILSLLFIVWGLVYLPPLYRRWTGRYGWKRNIVGRLAAFFITPILIAPGLPPSPQAQTPPPISARAVEASPVATPVAIESPKPSPSPSLVHATSEPEVVAESEPIFKEAETPVEPTPESIPEPKLRTVKTDALTTKSKTITTKTEVKQEAVEDAELNPLPEPESDRSFTPVEPSPEPVPQVSVQEPEPSPGADAFTPIREATYGQGCDCPYDLDRRGNSCGRRSAYSRPGGRSPICYVGDQ